LTARNVLFTARELAQAAPEMLIEASLALVFLKALFITSRQQGIKRGFWCLSPVLLLGLLQGSRGVEN